MKLYHELAEVYHEMYQHLFDYGQEFAFYRGVLDRFGAKKLIEFGCGTGNLARFFLQNKYDYLGVDLSESMLAIARREQPQGRFQQADLSRFSIDETFDAALITGRTITYLYPTKSLLGAFKGICACLKPGGMLIFDAIDAAAMFLDFDASEKQLDTGPYRRLSHSRPTLNGAWTWHWKADYFVKKEENYIFLDHDEAELRAFTKDELALLLKMCGFELLEMIQKDTYTWPDHYFIARKLDFM
jgi:SAM-dependent methyltransferase